MKSIWRLSLALVIFSLFSITYLVTSVSAEGVPQNSFGQPDNLGKVPDRLE
jgi:hypothetical protein